ncbi:hypothetical protein C8T65DRAFT_691336 [Cerioporus squamosus]|nr:hypothetical protein C8T65DRAFT_691336 [Cerioporus squamosus]
MESAGLSRLLMATLGFLRTVTQCSLEDNTLISTGLKLVGLVGTIGLALTVSGGVSTGNATSQSSLNSATTQRHVCVVLFALMYLGGVTLTALCWQRRSLILRHRRQMLKGIAATLPFLGVRVVYGVLGGFAPSPLTIVNGRQRRPREVTSASFEWGTLLVMSVLMEYIAVLVYAVVGVVTPLSKDVPDYRKTDTWSDSYLLYSKLR